MGLELRIIKDPCRDITKSRVRVFGAQGGIIGRSPDSYWVLPDPNGYVSSLHGNIEFRDGSFWLRDTSRNGIYMNGSREPIGNGNAVPLRHGDRVRVAEYELLVRLFNRHQDSPLVLPESADDAAEFHQQNDSGDFVTTGEAPVLNGVERTGDTGTHATAEVSVAATTVLDEAAAREMASPTGNGADPAQPAADAVAPPPVPADVAPRTTVAVPEEELPTGFLTVVRDLLGKPARTRHRRGGNAYRTVKEFSAFASTPERGRFKPATLDHSVMEKHCVLLGLRDTKAISAYKILRTRVRRRMIANDWRSLGVSGVAEGAGKTLTAVNLSIVLAQDSNNPSVLVDLDLYRPKVASYLGMTFDKGLSDYLLGEAEIPDILYSPGVRGFTVVPNNRPLQNASELLASPRMTALVSHLESLQPKRTIIYDLPPLLMSDDVLVFSPHMDCLLDVIAAGVTPRHSIERSREILSEFNVVGTVLNRAVGQDDTTYYYY